MQQTMSGVWSHSGSDAATIPNFAFGEEWQILGPFQIGTREAVWGADPLELHGGFRALKYDEAATFKSSVGANGTVGWSSLKARLPSPGQTQEAHCELGVSFPQIDWRGLQDVYGWAALQWQGWARGEIDVRFPGGGTVGLFTSNILEVWVDGQHYFGGDLYGYERAGVTLHLAQGKHQIDVRLVRDLRVNGAVGEPKLDVKLRVVAKGPLVVPVLPDNDRGGTAGLVISDIVGGPTGQLASVYASATLRNDAQQDAFIYAVEISHNQCLTELLSHPEPVRLVPGQTRPVPFRIACIPPIMRGPIPLTITHKYRLEGSPVPHLAQVFARPPARDLYESQKITFLHPGGMVSYAILRPPSRLAHCDAGDNATAPVLLALHGAGLEADSMQVRHSLDALPDVCAWTLFPAGVTPWSGDDWHSWGWADVEAAIAAIPAWIEQNDWKGVGVDTERWLVAGHSNGGQGTWYALTHRPDNIIAAAPLSAYSSIGNYVPYTFWRSADPGRTGVLQTTLNSYRHELLLENAKDIPLLLQHGDADDNVPVYHSRHMGQLAEEAGVQTQYAEMPGKPHWWDGAMTTEPVKHFLRTWLNAGGPAVSDAESTTTLPVNIRDFTVVSPGFGDVGPKHGVEILLTMVPGQMGKLHVTLDPMTLACVLTDSNVRMLRLPLLFRECSFLSVGGQKIATKPAAEDDGEGMTLMKQGNGRWTEYDAAASWPSFERTGRQLGAMDASLRTRGAFQIVRHSAGSENIALQVSRNLCQYFSADTVITSNYAEAKNDTSANIISVAIGTDLPADSEHPFAIYDDYIQVADHGIVHSTLR